MLRARLKSTGCRVLHRMGADRYAAFLRRSARTPVVLCYHRVVESFPSASATSIPAMLISTKMLEQHLDALARSYRFISLDQLAEAMEAGKPFERPAAAITFDDGYGDVYCNAFPLLKRKGIPAAVFVITELMGTGQLPLHDTVYFHLQQWFAAQPDSRLWLAALLERSGISHAQAGRLAARAANPYEAARALLIKLPQKDLLNVVRHLGEETPRPAARLLPQGAEERPENLMMSWEMLSEMQRSGLITVGSHTATHPVLTSETAAEKGQQLDQPRRQLENRLGAPIRHLAYPDGRFDAATLEIAAAAGYRFGYTTCSHRTQGACAPLAIPRRVLWEKSWLDSRANFSPEIMSCHLNGFFDWVAPCRQNHGLARRSGRVLGMSAAESGA